jgi:hypothetical protein
MISSEYKQLHFEVYEIELPYCSVCTPTTGVQGVWNTPLTCEESSDSTYKLYFTKNSSPSIRQPSQSITGNSYLNSSIFKCVGSGSETTPLLKAGRGLASRSTMSVSMTDFNGDPGPLNVSDSGTFFGKLLARNVLEGKQIKTYYYTKDDTQSAPYIVKTSTHYITSASLSGGMFRISGKDGLKDLEKNSAKFPSPTDLNLTADIDENTTQIPYEGQNITFVVDNVIKIGKELMQVVSSAPGVLTVKARGDNITKFGEVISTTENSSHLAGDAIQKCLPENSDIDIVLLNIFSTAGLLQFYNGPQWSEEVSAWNAGAKIKGVYHEPEDCIDVINQILTDYTLDMYLDQNTNKAVLSSVSQWLVPTIEPVEEGNDFTAYKEQVLNNERFSRAFIKVVKPNQTDNDDLTNYERIALFTDLETETSDFYGDIKTEQFEPSQTLQFTDAQVLVSRYVKRYAVPPKKIMFNMEERKISNIELGDVIDIRARDKQLYDGTTEEAFNRAQVIKIQPKFNQIGRSYDVTAMSYIPEFGSNPDPVVITGSTTTINIYNQLGNPNVPVDAVIILDGGDFGSDTISSPTIRAGSLLAGSTIKIFCINGARVGSKGGRGGDATVTESGSFPFVISTFADNGGNGGNVYNSDGIETHFYVNYSAIDGFTASSELYTGGGGGGGAAATVKVDFPPSQPVYLRTAISGGSGGSGIIPGQGGIATSPGGAGGTIVYDKNNGIAGDFEAGGASVVTTSTVSVSGGNAVVTAFGEGGGQSSGPSVSSTDITFSVSNPPDELYRDESVALGGLPGEAFTGGNITVYNLSADASKFRDGASVEGVDYTLVSS